MGFVEAEIFAAFRKAKVGMQRLASDTPIFARGPYEQGAIGGNADIGKLPKCRVGGFVSQPPTRYANCTRT